MQKTIRYIKFMFDKLMKSDALMGIIIIYFMTSIAVFCVMGNGVFHISMVLYMAPGLITMLYLSFKELLRGFINVYKSFKQNNREFKEEEKINESIR